MTENANMTTQAAWIHGTIADSARHEGIHPRLAKALAFLRRPDLTQLPVGRYPVDGDDAWAMVQDVELKPWSEPTQHAEVHAAFIDVQAPLDGPETYGLKRIAAPFQPFDAEKDVSFGDLATEPLTLKPGEYAIFMPNTCAHAPCKTREASSVRRRKLVIKVRF